jgi:hypothetical protein
MDINDVKIRLNELELEIKQLEEDNEKLTKKTLVFIKR